MGTHSVTWLGSGPGKHNWGTRKVTQRRESSTWECGPKHLALRPVGSLGGMQNGPQRWPTFPGEGEEGSYPPTQPLGLYLALRLAAARYLTETQVLAGDLGHVRGDEAQGSGPCPHTCSGQEQRVEERMGCRVEFYILPYCPIVACMYTHALEHLTK